MTDMIRKVAEAGAEEYTRLAPLFISGAVNAQAVWTAVAAASIAAMRHPVPEMCVRAHQVALGGGQEIDVYQAMVDAALGEDSYQVPVWPRVVSRGRGR